MDIKDSKVSFTGLRAKDEDPDSIVAATEVGTSNVDTNDGFQPIKIQFTRLREVSAIRSVVSFLHCTSDTFLVYTIGIFFGYRLKT